MILDPKFEQLVSRNFLRSSREYDLAKYFWANSERAMQGKPTQQAVLTTKNLTEDKQTYVTDELAKYFAGFSWSKPELMPTYNHQSNSVPNEHCFTRAELQSMQANNRKLIQVVQEDINSWLTEQTIYRQGIRNNGVDIEDPELILHMRDQLDYIRNKISSNKLKLKKLVALQTKVKRLLSVRAESANLLSA